MALWHYAFRLVPKAAFEKMAAKMSLYDIFYEDDILWKDSGMKKDLFNSISSFMPRSKSWSDKLYIFGREEGSNLSISVEDDGNTVDSVSLRISFVEDDYEMKVFKLAQFFNEHDFYVISENLHAFLPDSEKMVYEITHSSRIGTYVKLSTKKN